ncbi:MAG: YybH family protein [Gemmatimonadota bacterium]
MNKWRMMPALALGLLVLPATAPAQEQMAAEEVSIDRIQADLEEMQVAFETALNGDDPASTARFYTADAVLMPPGMSAIEGVDAIGEFFGQGMGGATLDLEIWDVHAQGSDVALETGSYEITGAEGDHLDHGKYIVVWALTDDGWKMKYDMWNSSMAPPEKDHDEMHEKMHRDEGHEMKEKADDAMEAADMDDDGDGVPTADEDDEM